jgi:hypothetical protein
VRRTGGIARAALENLQARYPEIILKVRGLGVMLAFDVARADWRDMLRDRAFRRGLILLPAGERTLRFYPRYDTPEAVIREAVEILAAAAEDILTGGATAPMGPLMRVGTAIVPRDRTEVIELNSRNFADYRAGVMAVEIERYGTFSQYPPDVPHKGRRPLLQFPEETIKATLGHPGALGLALRFTGRTIAFVVGSPLENHDEEGVHDDPHFGEHRTFYLHAMAVHPSVENLGEIERHLLDRLYPLVINSGYQCFSALIEERVRDASPPWLQQAEILRTVDNYMGSGLRFIYLHARIAGE